MANIELTREQKIAIPLLGGPVQASADDIPKDILDELVKLGLIEWKPEITDKGDLVYDRVRNEQMS